MGVYRFEEKKWRLKQVIIADILPDQGGGQLDLLDEQARY